MFWVLRRKLKRLFILVAMSVHTNRLGEPRVYFEKIWVKAFGFRVWVTS